jgi:hypothetical protein
MQFVTAPEDWSKVQAAVAEIRAELHRASPDRLKRLLQQSVPEYTPFIAANEDAAAKPPAAKSPAVVVPGKARTASGKAIILKG